MLNLQKKEQFYYDTSDSRNLLLFSKSLENILRKYYSQDQKLVFLCIGTDRATGDSLGPMIGYKLSRLPLKNAVIYGDLDSPVHAQNLTKTLMDIRREYSNHFIVAIDASLGKKEQIGYISLKPKGIHPGLGVNKDLPLAGDISITGIVNMNTSLNQLLLQTTRLHTVMQLADFICAAIFHCCNHIFCHENVVNPKKHE